MMDAEEKKRRQSIASAKWAKANPEKVRASRAAFKAKNPDLCAQRNRANVKRYKKEHPEIVASWPTNSPEKTRARARRWQKANPEKANASATAWRAKNPEKAKAIAKKCYRKRAAERPHVFRAYEAQRRASELKATPSWADQEKIAEMYEAREFAEDFFGAPIDVDHVVPLVSRRVCGLHCEQNLQLLSKRENIRKGNRVWPDMAEAA